MPSDRGTTVPVVRFLATYEDELGGWVACREGLVERSAAVGR